MINKIDKERRRSMNATPTQPGNRIYSVTFGWHNHLIHWKTTQQKSKANFNIYAINYFLVNIYFQILNYKLFTNKLCLIWTSYFIYSFEYQKIEIIAEENVCNFYHFYLFFFFRKVIVSVSLLFFFPFFFYV
jgi:hypothetical protein